MGVQEKQTNGNKGVKKSPKYCGHHMWMVPEEVLAVELESLVDDGEEEAANHGADEASHAVDL